MLVDKRIIAPLLPKAFLWFCEKVERQMGFFSLKKVSQVAGLGERIEKKELLKVKCYAYPCYMSKGTISNFKVYALMGGSMFRYRVKTIRKKLDTNLRNGRITR